METADGSDTLTDQSSSTLATAIHTLRERSRGLLRDQEDRLRQLESQLEQQLASAVEQLARDTREAAALGQEQSEQVESLEREVCRLQQLRTESDQALEENRKKLNELQDESRVLRVKLDDAEQRLAGNAPSVPGDAEETERLHRRLELAMQEIRDLQQQNSQLQEQTKRSPASPVPAASAQFDWETQKRRLLEQLEDGFDTSKPTEAKEKLRCEDVIKETERIIAAKDREIAELRRQLESQPAAGTSPADLKSATAELLDADSAIQAERARLAQLQSEWEDKLRRAEVEVSIERAKIARERLQLEEKLRMLQSKGNEESPDSTSADTKPGNRGRWLTRLGLRGEKDKEGEF